MTNIISPLDTTAAGQALRDKCYILSSCLHNLHGGYRLIRH